MHKSHTGLSTIRGSQVAVDTTGAEQVVAKVVRGAL